MMRGRKPIQALAGDVGGTKVDLALFEAGGVRPRGTTVRTYASRAFSGLESILDRFLAEVGPVGHIEAACFGVAGPVVAGRSSTTNLPWVVSESGLRRRFGWPQVRLINDLSATALAVPMLSGRELAALNRARPRRGGNCAVVAPGTGLGQALLVFEHGRPIAVPSEGGHADFAPACRQEAALWDYLHRRFGHVSAERVLSGAGQVHIYEWLRESGRWREPAWLAAALARADPARVITDAALARRQPLCVAAVNRFVSILGAVSGNLALTGLATGGLYLGGGIPPRLLPVLRDGPFLEAFAAKGRFRTLLQNIAVRVILNRQAALIGAASTALSIARGK